MSFSSVNINCHPSISGLLKRITLEVAPIYLSGKPSALVQLRKCSPGETERPAEIFAKYQNLIAWHLGLDYRIMRTTETGMLVLFYSKTLLARTLNKPEICKFLKSINYTSQTLNESLDTLALNFSQTESIPHEVGVFLGYPLKDVQGFIAKQTPAPVSRTLWKIFGDTRESLSLMQSFTEATQHVAAYIKRENDIEKLAFHFRRTAAVL